MYLIFMTFNADIFHIPLLFLCSSFLRLNILIIIDQDLYGSANYHIEFVPAVALVEYECAGKVSFVAQLLAHIYQMLALNIVISKHFNLADDRHQEI